MILACHNLNKSFGDHLIVRDGSFHVEDREKAALVGVNGAGKSTIFRMIVGELPLDEGDVILTKGKTLGYLDAKCDRRRDSGKKKGDRGVFYDKRRCGGRPSCPETDG